MKKMTIHNVPKVLFATLLMLMLSIGAAAQWGPTLTHNIDSLFGHPMFQRTQVAVYVYDLDADTVVYDRGSRQLMRPASVMKVLTSTAALHNLGADHPFITTLSYSGTIERDTLLPDSVEQHNVLHGDLYLRGGFDPLFGPDDMRAFIQSLREQDIRRIDGTVYADLSFKDTLKWGQGWCWDDKATTLTPLLYNAKDIFMTRFMQSLDADSIVRPANYRRLTQGGLERDTVTLCCRIHTISQMIGRMMKESDNLFAESLFYQLGRSGRKAA